MTIVNNIVLDNNIVFKSEVENQSNIQDIKSDLVRTPESDTVQIETETKPKKKKHILRNIIVGITSAIALTYGGIVLHRKLSKPTFAEVQKYFKEIFQKDLSDTEIKELISKYKQICKCNKTEEFTKKMIEQLKKDYGLEQVEIDLTVKKLKDSKLKTALARKERGNANPLGEVNIMPGTSGDRVIRSIQGETFSTGFHEMKHLKQFSDAYRADADKFAEAILNLHIKDSSTKKAEFIKEYKDGLFNKFSALKNLDKDTVKEFNLTQNEIEEMFKCYSIDDLIKQTMEKQGLKTDEDIFNFVKKQKIKGIRELLDLQYGKLERFTEGSEEYRNGLEYIRAYENYPNPEKDYDAYKKNLLEKEAWDVGGKAQKIYKYLSSIWKI